MQRLSSFVTVLLVAATMIGCDEDPKPDNVVKREGQPDVAYVADDDPKMTAAINQARTTVDQFIAALNNSKPSQSAFSVKLPIVDGEHGEHMWILPVRYEGGKFYGKINNEPDRVTTVKIGDEVSVAKEEISDWMFVDNRKLMGGYTIRVLRDSLPENERSEFDQSVPFTFD